MAYKITYDQAMHAVQITQWLHDQTGAFFDAQGQNPTPGSLAATELREFSRPDSVLTAYSQGIALIELAADHLIAFTKTITEPAQSIAPWTITRSVLEASALSCWLLDIKLDARERVMRSLAFRYDGLIEQAKFLQASRLANEAEQVSIRIDEIEAMAESLGFKKLRNGTGTRTGIGQVMPSVTEVIRDTLDDEAFFRLYSAMAHAHNWAYSQLSFRKVGKAKIEQNEGVLMEKHLPIELVWLLCTNVTRYFARPIRFRTELYGWDKRKLNTIIDEAFREIGVQQKSAS